MKKILLASVALTAFAGAAAAEVNFAGDASLGYNDDVEDGFYWTAGMTAKMSQELDNGVSVAASLDIDLAAAGSTAQALDTVSTSDWTVTISNADGSLSFGDVVTAASTFAFVGDMDAGINDHTEDYAGSEAGLLAKYSFGDFSVAASAQVADTAAGNAATNTAGVNGATQVAAAGSFGGINVGILSVADETNADLTQDDALLVSLGGTFAGVDVTVNAGNVNNVDRMAVALSYAVGDYTLGASYSDDDGNAEATTSYSVAYAAGAVTAKGYYTDNRGGVNGDNEWSVAVAYDMGNGLVINAGIIDGETAGATTDDDQYNYIAADYNLGGGASFLVSYADANNDATLNSADIDTTLGGYELMSGLTAELNFAF